MRSRRTKRFHKLFAQLPSQVQQDAIEAYQTFRSNPYHPSLQFKRIDPRDPIYSVRIGRRYRALGWYEGDIIRWYWIGSHEDYNKL
ncbi:MAG: hypothetical protein NVS4B11_24890 [Ktedonobacteraceae bacterium]